MQKPTAGSPYLPIINIGYRMLMAGIENTSAFGFAHQFQIDTAYNDPGQVADSIERIGAVAGDENFDDFVGDVGAKARCRTGCAVGGLEFNDRTGFLDRSIDQGAATG